MYNRIIMVIAFVFAAGCGSPDSGRTVNPVSQDRRAPVLFEQLAKLPREAGQTPTPLESGPNPGTLRDGKPLSGTFVSASHKTAVIVEEYENGQRNGLSIGYHSENIKHWEGRYIKGAKDGVFRVWDAAGQLMSTETFRNGVRINEDE